MTVRDMVNKPRKRRKLGPRLALVCRLKSLPVVDSGAQVVECREDMTLNDMEKFIDWNVLIAAAHASRSRPKDNGRQVFISPQPRVGCTEADDRHRLDARQ